MKIWSQKEIDFIKKWYPHFGKHWVARELKQDYRRVKSKVDKMGILMLPKHERLCIQCKINFQKNRVTGYFCSECFKERRKLLRRKRVTPLKKDRRAYTFEQRIRELLRTIKYRKSDSDLTLEFLLELWNKQEGKCFYSGLKMLIPDYGTSSGAGGRSPFSFSIDKIIPEKGYVKGNVVWCCWAVNAGKNNFSLDDYYKICSEVVKHHGDVLAELANE